MEEQSRIDHYAVLTTLGKGGQAICKTAIDTTDGRMRVLKIFDLSNEKADENLKACLREVEVYQNLKHDNLLSFYGG